MTTRAPRPVSAVMVGRLARIRPSSVIVAVLSRGDDPPIPPEPPGGGEDSGTFRSARSSTVAPLTSGSGRVMEIACHYDGPDLADVAGQWGVPPERVPAIHAGLAHEVAFCGFAPGFPYIAGLGGGHETARRDQPRSSVPAGSVALGDEYTGIYPRTSPGGWRSSWKRPAGIISMRRFRAARSARRRVS